MRDNKGMGISKLKLKVTSPYFYYTQGGVYGETGPFLGDVPVAYSIAYSLGLLPYPLNQEMRIRNLGGLPFLVTVGRPIIWKVKRIIAISSSFENSLSKFSEIFLR